MSGNIPSRLSFLPMLLFLPSAAGAEFAFEEAVVDPQYLTNPWGKAVGDLDGDGFPDLAVATAYNLAIHWYRHPGWTRHTLSHANGGDDLQIADVDGDGDLDVLSNGSTILWHRNPTAEGGDPAGIWVARTVWYGGRSHDLSTGDVDGNGRLDVLIRRESGPTWVIFQTGPDAWTPVHIPAASNGTGSALADLDRDGRLDVVENGFWLKQPANPIGGTWTRHDFAAWGPNSAVGVADINRDGRADVFLSTAYSLSRLSWFEAPADPRAGNWAERAVGNPANHVHRFHLADMDKDGYLDVVFAEQHQSPERRVGIFRNADAAGGAWELQVLSTAGSHNIALGDIGRDGDLDIFGVNWRADTRPRLWINRAGSDTLPPAPLPPPAPTGLSAAPGDGQVTLSWPPAKGASAYNLYFRQGSSVTRTDGARIGGVAPPYVLDRLANGVEHAFAVSAYNEAGESGLGSAVTATPKAPPPPPSDTLDPSGRKPYLGTARVLPGILQAEDFDEGGEGLAYHDADVPNQGGQYRATAVDVGNARDVDGGYYVGWIGTGEWLEYTVRVARAGNYRLEARVSSPFRNRGFHVEWNRRDVSGPVRVPFTDGWHAWTTHGVDMALPDTGLGTLRVHVDSMGFNLNSLRFVPVEGNPAPP